MIVVQVPSYAQATSVAGYARRPMETLAPAASAPPVLILDTQVVMDWLVFGYQGMGALINALELGTVEWIATPSMLDELKHVLGRGVAARWSPDLAHIEAVFARHCRMRPLPTLGHGRPRCTDPDDQKFVDLAIAERVDWLISRDKAVLALRKRVARLGPQILTPEPWCALWQARAN